MTARLPRRSLMTLGAGAALSGCGFQPVYMPTASGSAGVAQRELAAIHVALIPDRPGQLLRQALQDRLERGVSGVQSRYELKVSFWVEAEGIAVESGDITTRLRGTGNARWTLQAQDPGQTVLTKGQAQSLDALNVLDTQYFATDLELEALFKRVSDALADQITMQLAVYFRKRAAATG
jgi:LPS-assembly lipoprotein